MIRLRSDIFQAVSLIKKIGTLENQSQKFNNKNKKTMFFDFFGIQKHRLSQSGKQCVCIILHKISESYTSFSFLVHVVFQEKRTFSIFSKINLDQKEFIQVSLKGVFRSYKILKFNTTGDRSSRQQAQNEMLGCL